MEPIWHRHYEAGVPYSLDYPDLIVSDMLSEAARTHPRRTAAVFLGGRVSYRELEHLADLFANALRGLGLEFGDRVAIHLPNCPQFMIAYYGALRAGCVVVPVNPLYQGEDLAGILRDSEARVVVTLTKLYPNLAAVRDSVPAEHYVVGSIKEYLPPHLRFLFTLAKEKKEGHAFPRGEEIIPFQRFLDRGHRIVQVTRRPEPWDLAQLQYTGGTTGLPKAAQLTHRNLVANVIQAAAWVPTFRRGKEIFACALPFFHVYGLTACLNLPVYLASTGIQFPQFNAKDVLAGVAKNRVTFFPTVPAMLVAMNHVRNIGQYNLSSVRLFFSGAAPLPPEVKQRFEELSGGVVVEAFGLSEASPVTHGNPGYGLQKTGSIGLPMPDTVARIVDLETGERELPVGEDGELVIRGPQVMQGYWNRPEETARALRDGWLYTGDVARMDEDGYFFIVDRIKDMVIVGGFNVYPREIEDLLYQHPKVKEAAVAGVSHPIRGETLVAHVVPVEGETLAPSEIVSFCRERLAAYKVPRRVKVVDAIPKTLVGKALRREIREREGHEAAETAEAAIEAVRETERSTAAAAEDSDKSREGTPGSTSE